MIAAFVEKLLAEPGVTKVQTDPDPENMRAVRCYEKAGFRPVRKVTTPDGPALLMVFEKARVEAHASAV
jgi:RimJ/RimL family protein N-acetyltransferase